VSRPSVVLDPEQDREVVTPTAEQGQGPLDRAHRRFEFSFRGPWFTTDEAAAYVGCPTREAFRKWAHRRGIVLVERGVGGRLLVAKADLDRALRVRQAR